MKTTTRRALGLLLVVLGAGACSPAQPTLPSPILPPLEVAVAPPNVAEGAPIAPTDAGAPGALVATAPPSTLEAVLREWSRSTQCQEFDYHPRGGIQSFWCHRPSRVTLASVGALAGVDVFTSGPHTADALKLDEASDFGRYNPAFVRWLVTAAGPSERGSAAQKATQAAYDAHLAPLADIFWKTYAKSQADKSCFAREKATYADLIARRKLPSDYYERWFFFMNPYFCDKGHKPANYFYDNAFDAGVDGNVTKTVIGFWLRRSIDGTFDAFADGLKKLLAAYQPELLATPTRWPDGAALTRAIDAGLRGAAACRDGRAKAATSSIAITISPDGHLAARLMAPRAQASAPQVECIETKVSAATAPPFDGESLVFNRTIALR